MICMKMRILNCYITSHNGSLINTRSIINSNCTNPEIVFFRKYRYSYTALIHNVGIKWANCINCIFIMSKYECLFYDIQIGIVGNKIYISRSTIDNNTIYNKSYAVCEF